MKNFGENRLASPSQVTWWGYISRYPWYRCFLLVRKLTVETRRSCNIISGIFFIGFRGRKERDEKKERIMSEEHLLDQWKIIVNNPDDAINSFIPDRLLKELTRDTVNFIRKETKLYLDALFGTILTACKAILQSQAWQAEEGLMSIVIAFLCGLISSPELNCNEKRIVVDLLKRSSFHMLFFHTKGIFAAIIPDIMCAQSLAAISEDVQAAQLLLLDCLVSGLCTSYEVIQLLYTDLTSLTTMDAMLVMNDEECEEFMGRQRPGVISLSAFVTHQIRNGPPRCRELAYRVMVPPSLIHPQICHSTQPRTYPSLGHPSTQPNPPSNPHTLPPSTTYHLGSHCYTCVSSSRDENRSTAIEKACQRDDGKSMGHQWGVVEFALCVAGLSQFVVVASNV